MDLKLLLTAVWTAAGTVVFLLNPAVAPFFLPLALVAPLLWSRGETRDHQRVLTMSALSGLLALTSAYLLINATWSTEPTRAFVAVAIFIVLSLVLHVLTRTLPELHHKPLRAMAVGFYAGYVIAALLLSIELALDHPLHVGLFRAFPAITPRMRELVTHDSVVQNLPSTFLNFNIAALLALLWSALAITWHLGHSRRTRAVLLACLLPSILAVYLSNHETSKVALVAGAAAFLIAWLIPRATYAVMVIAWLVACTAVVPLASLAYNLDLHRAEWLQPSARHRIVIWGVTSQQTADAVLFGHGIVTARQIGKQQQEHPMYAAGTNFPLSVGPHAHNAYLQVWFDAGAFGAVLLLMIGLSILYAISRLPPNVRPALYALYATVAVLAAASFSLWAQTFLASLGITSIFAILAWSFAAAMQNGVSHVEKNAI